MKVMIVTPYFYPKPGGLEHYAYSMSRALLLQGHQVVIITSSHDEPSKQTEEMLDGIKVYRLPRQIKLSNTPYSFAWKRQIKKIISTEHPDLINAHTPVPGIADSAERVRADIPFVLTYHNDLVKPGLILGLLAKTAYHFLGINKTLRRADTIIATSSYYAEHSPYLLPQKEKIAVVAPGVDLEAYSPKVNKMWLSDTYGKAFTVLFVGQLDKTHAHKGLSVLIDAVAILKEKGNPVRLMVVGRGDAIADYKARAKLVGVDDIVFTGYVSAADLPAYYAGADIEILPSLTNAEGFGMVLMEASACGTPVIGSNIGGIPQAVVDGQTGLLFKPGNAQALAAAVAKLQSDPKFAKKLGDAGALRAKRDFGWKQLARKTEIIYDTIIRGAA